MLVMGEETGNFALSAGLHGGGVERIEIKRGYLAQH
jgi:hypothetical protein